MVRNEATLDLLTDMQNFGGGLSLGAMKRVTKEMQTLASSPPEGIRVIINESDCSDIQAWILGPEGTPFANGIFKVKLILSNDFPQSPPKGLFVTKIFHPNVSKAGEICVNTLKKDWKKELGIGHILLTIKCLLIAPNPESALNEEAGKLLLERYEEYAKHAELMTSIHAVYKSLPVEFSTPSKTDELDKRSATPPSLRPQNLLSPSNITLSPLQLSSPKQPSSTSIMTASAALADAIATSPAPLSEANSLLGPPIVATVGDKLSPPTTLIGKKRVASQNIEKGVGLGISAMPLKTAASGPKKTSSTAKRSLKRL